MYNNINMESRYCKNFAEKFKEIRVSKGYSKTKLCEQVGCDLSYIGKIESGKKIPTLKMFFKFAIALNVSPKEFFEFE